MSSDHRNPQRDERSAASPSEGALTVGASGNTLAPQLHAVIGLWANATTGDGLRKRDLLRDKEKVLTSFFTFADKPPAQIDAGDIAAWQRHLEAENYAPATVYAMISRVSSFYEWAIKEPQLARVIRANPVRLARPKAPIPYQGESTKALSLEDVQAIFAEIRNHFGSKNEAERLCAMRDNALLLWFMLSGLRRQEVLQLTWGKVKLRADGSCVIETRVKGGRYAAVEIRDGSAQDALTSYLRASGRLSTMREASPLWIAHDRGRPTRNVDYTTQRRKGGSAQPAEQPLTSHGFVQRLKRYATAAGVHHIHLHQTRHTFAAWVGEETGDYRAVQAALGHQDLRTTFIYAQRLGVRRDNVSSAIAQKLELPPLPIERDDSVAD